jgi:polysaccharide biosynthesis protein PslH
MAKVLSVITYPFYPPSNGGALRCFYLLRALAEVHEVDVLTVQPAADFVKDGEPLFPTSIRVISLADEPGIRSFLHFFLPKRFANAIHARLMRRSLKAKANEFLLKAYPALRHVLKTRKYDAVVYENLEGLVFLKDIISRRNSQALHLLDAHNVDSSLWLQYAAIEQSESLQVYARNALETEKRLQLLTDHVFACSEQDAAVFQDLNSGQLSITVVPNGVDVENKAFDTNTQKALIHEIIFCGALSTHANKEGLLWFYNSVYPIIQKKMPAIRFTVVGHVQDETPFQKLKDDPTVNFEGPVASVQPYYQRCSVAVVPLLSGSGTRLKILEAMSLGNPVISTAKGAEGIIYEDGLHLFIADEATAFAEKVVYLLQHPSVFHSVRTAARYMAEQVYDWRIIGKKMSAAIAQLIIERKH